uniref:Gustatory receptor n=1 Tax=Anopheles culicifacies TaxID=139723 RepID=A0A182M2U7_9DIPT
MLLYRALGSPLIRKCWDQLFTFTDTVDYFNLLNTSGTLFALHYYSEDSRWTMKKLLWTVYRTCYLMSYLSYCYKAYWMLRNWEYSTASANVLGALGLCSGALLRLIVIELNYPTIRKLQAFLNDRTYLSEDRWAWNERSKLYRHNNCFLVVLITAITVESLFFLARLLLTRPEFMLQYNGRVLGGSLVQIVYGMVTACWGIIYVLSFIVFYMLLAGFRLEMELLARSFQLLEGTLLDGLEHIITTNDQDGRQYWNKLQTTLTVRIKRHVQLLENLRLFRSIVAPFAFLQYYCTFGLIADSFFVVSFEGFTAYSMAYVLFASFLILESLLLCRGVEDLNDLQTLRFSYGAHGEISMHSFAELMQKSYSMLTFMLQLQN